MPPSRLEVEAIESLVAAAEGDFPPSFKLLSGGVAVPGTGADVESRDDRTLSGGGEEADDDERDLEKACLNASIGKPRLLFRQEWALQKCVGAVAKYPRHISGQRHPPPGLFVSESGLF